MTVYSHTQHSRMLRRIFALAAVVTFIAVLLALPNVAGWIIVLIIACGAIGYAMALQFSSLTAEVTEETLTWWFGRGIWRKSVPLAEIASAEPVINRWWWGWGIRYYGKGWLYNVSGLDAVEIVQKSGKHLRIGTDDPAGLAEALAGRIAGT